jgi:probable rRNA maturation factor
MTPAPNAIVPTTPAIDIIVDSPQWRAQPESATILRRAIAAAAAVVSTPDAELAIVLSDDSAIRALNRQWRGLDKPTNVLSFPAGIAAHGTLGDIVIAFETVAREAAAEGKPFTDHLAHLAVHGFLHLLGYDHATDDEADAMERLESAILAKLAVPDPYGVRDALA